MISAPVRLQDLFNFGSDQRGSRVVVQKDPLIQNKCVSLVHVWGALASRVGRTVHYFEHVGLSSHGAFGAEQRGGLG